MSVYVYSENLVEPLCCSSSSRKEKILLVTRPVPAPTSMIRRLGLSLRHQVQQPLEAVVANAVKSFLVDALR